MFYARRWLIGSHPQVTEVGILQHTAVGAQGLFENLLPVSHEKQAMAVRIVLRKELIIEG